MLDIVQLLLEANQGLIVTYQLLRGLHCGHRQHLWTTQQQPEGKGFDRREDQHNQHGITWTDIQGAQRGIAQRANDTSSACA